MDPGEEDMDQGEGMSIIEELVSATDCAKEVSIFEQLVRAVERGEGIFQHQVGAIDSGEWVSNLEQVVSSIDSAELVRSMEQQAGASIDTREGVSRMEPQAGGAIESGEGVRSMEQQAGGVIDSEEGVRSMEQQAGDAVESGEGVRSIEQQVRATIDSGEGVSKFESLVRDDIDSGEGISSLKPQGRCVIDSIEGLSSFEQQKNATKKVPDKRILEHCEALGILENVLLDIVCGREIEWTKLNAVSLVNGVLVELAIWLKKQRKNAKLICKLVDELFIVNELSDDQQRNMQKRVELVCVHEKKMRARLRNAIARNSKNRQDVQDQLNVFERSVFDYQPQVRKGAKQSVNDVNDIAATSADTSSVRDDDLDILRYENERLRGKCESVLQENRILKEKLDDLRTKYKSSLFQAANKLFLVRKENKQLGSKNEKLMAAYKKMASDCELAKENMQELNRHITKLKRSEKQLVRMRMQLRDGKKMLPLKEKESKARDPTLALQKYKKYMEKFKKNNRTAKNVLRRNGRKLENELKKANEKMEFLRATNKNLYSAIGKKKNSIKARQEKVCEEKKKVAGLRKEIRELKDTLAYNDGEYNDKPCSFKDKQTYVPKIREVYQDLMIKHGVSSTKCEGVVRTVLTGLTDIPLDKLPKTATACTMLLEGRKIAQVQVARALVEGEDLTVASDATTKFGHHFSSFDVYRGSEDHSGPSSMTIGVRESIGGSAQTTLDTLLSILQEVSDMPGSTHTVQKMIANIKNTMSDRHVAEKKFNNLLRNYRETILPDIIKGWDDMDSEERTKFSSMNDFYCGLHYMVGLANYSSSAIQAWERMIFGNDKVGAEALRGVNVESGCGTVRLVRSVCKAVQDRGCQETGKPVEFRSFLGTKGISSVPLAPFKGNRFNIVFHNGAGVFFLAAELKEFCKEQSKEGNQLFRAIHADLCVNQYLAAVRALGLIDKLVTGPLWKVINEPGHIATMNEQYTAMHSCFERWSNDSSMFMLGEDVMFEGKHDPSDPIFKELVTPNTELDPMTKQVLEVIFLTYSQVTEKMLEDHLPSGKHFKMGKKKVSETKSVPKTNVGVERDFGMLDRLMRLKPSASMTSMEGIIMGVRNKTSEWRQGLSVTDREELMKYARQSVKTQRQEYAKRVKQLWDERAAKRLSQQQKAEELEEKRRLKTESVYVTVVELCGGIWMCESEVHDRLEGESEKRASEMLQAQLQARRHVFHEPNTQGRLNICHKGKKRSVLELKKCLLGVIRDASNRSEEADSRPVEEVEYASMCASEEKLTEYHGHVEKKRRKAKNSATNKEKNRVKYDDLVGKIVDHLTLGEGGREEWRRAIVTSRSRKGLKLSYDSEPGAIYEYSKKEIEDHLDSGELKMAKLTMGDIVGRNINQRFDVDDELIWYRGYISSVTKGQECLVMYDPVGEEGDEMESSWEGPILEEYKNHDVRFIRPM